MLAPLREPKDVLNAAACGFHVGAPDGRDEKAHTEPLETDSGSPVRALSSATSEHSE